MRVFTWFILVLVSVGFISNITAILAAADYGKPADRAIKAMTVSLQLGILIWASILLWGS